MLRSNAGVPADGGGVEVNQEATGSGTTWGIKRPSEASDTETPPPKEVCRLRFWKIPPAPLIRSMFPAGRDPLPWKAARAVTLWDGLPREREVFSSPLTHRWISEAD